MGAISLGELNVYVARATRVPLQSAQKPYATFHHT